MKFTTIYIFVFLFFGLSLQATAQFNFSYADPPFVTHPSVRVIYTSPVILPTKADSAITRNLKVSIETSTSAISVSATNVQVWINRYGYNYRYLTNLGPDSTFNFTSAGIGSYVQFVFATDPSTTATRLVAVDGVYGWSPTIAVPYGDEFGNLRLISTSVDVPAELGFRVVPNPVTSSFVDIWVPSDVPKTNVNTRFRIITVGGNVIIDTPVVDIITEGPTIAAQNLQNGAYIAQLYNTVLGINRTYNFTVNR